MELSKELISAYLGGMSLRECEAKFGIQKDTIRYNLRKLGIKVKSKKEVIAEKLHGAPWRDKDLMFDLYVVQRKSSIEIADIFGCDSSVVTDWLHAFNFDVRSTSETQKGKSPGNKGKGKRNSSEMVLCACGCGTELKRFNYGSGEVRYVNGHRLKGDAHPLFKPFSMNKSRKREGSEYREWRKEVLKNSKYTCAACGKVGGPLHAHRVIFVSHHPEFALDVLVGKAMCKPCHTELHVAFREIFNANRK